MKPLNHHGDQPKFLATGHGADIASQRADDLDMKAIERTRSLTAPFALDIACGAGGQSVRLAQNGASVLATDIADMSEIVLAAAKNNAVADRISFVRMDMRGLEGLRLDCSADVIICQRAIHYLRFQEAVEVLVGMKQLLDMDGQLFLSASGIHSELGDGYDGQDMPLEARYIELAPSMRDRHGIHGPVCLYSEDDMRRLLTTAGFAVKELFSSTFGNIKAVATHV